ncbi:MAG: hypothetical protein HON90_07530 [Halobacteriovoraceae bacterium]|jgi:hypothetical protein|nr:hypothetical protein [Halobacteriovoraceae bacterium]
MKKLFKKITAIVLPLFILSGCIEVNLQQIKPEGIGYRSAIEPEETDEELQSGEITNRPSDAIILKNPCLCLDQVAQNIGNCTQVCKESSSVNSFTPHLILETELTSAITNTDLFDLAGFCSTQAGEAEIASCYLEVIDEKRGITSEFEVISYENSEVISIVADEFSEDHTYRLTLVERASGARSRSTQLRFFNEYRDFGPISLMPVNRFKCEYKIYSESIKSDDLAVYNIDTQYYFFSPPDRPDALRESSNSIVLCHNIEMSGTVPINSPLLDEQQSTFITWNKTDPLFYDINEDGKQEVYNIIGDEYKAFTGMDLAPDFKLFYPLTWRSGITDNGSINQVESVLGYYMTPFLDDNTYKAYCPKQHHYYGRSDLFRSLRGVVGVDTEGLYIAKEQGADNYTLINEALLKQIWFYKSGEKHIVPDDQTVAENKIEFYWPADTAEPFIKKKHQMTFSLKFISEVDTFYHMSESRQHYPAHDKRFGCIPMLTN